MIKQIWFDFGNVFIPIFPQRTKEAFEEQGVQFTEESIQRLNQEYELGVITSGQFFQEIASSCKCLQGSKDIARAWNALLGKMTDPTLFLKRLAASYNLCLVSNTNEAHIRSIRKQAGPFLWNSFVEKFEALFLSYEIGLRKPDDGYFNYVLEYMDAKPEEVLFVDDSPNNIKAAEALGINTVLFNIQEQDLTKELPAVLAKFN
ncbi:MAG TPA: haloacid dehalogenase [Cryomorphaceae bacterium]|nr:haloacid dehalogenase [Cryomorphaceae bacterium]|tara:strand:+ start:244 stop:855 length:612 start_codon:yes stop_codon:yes gene_type:complete